MATVSTLLRDFALAASEYLWPRRCFVCSAPSTGDFCPTCEGSLATDPHETCPHCAYTVGPHTDTSSGCPSCRTAKFPFVAAVRLGPYGGLLQEVIVRAKQTGGEGLAEALGQLMAESRQEQLRKLNVDCIVPVPLHWQRRWARGFNQAEVVGWGLATLLQIPLLPFALRRTRPTPKQAGRTRAERAENVLEAFVPAQSLSNLRVLLIDDVLTTGATLTAASRVALQAGAAQVTVAVLARRM